MAENVQRVILTADDQTRAAFSSFRSSIKGANESTSKLTRASSALKSQILAVGAAYLTLSSAVRGGRAILDANIKLQQLTNTLEVGTGSAKGAANAYSFVRVEANRLGLDLAVSAEQFAKLTAASKGTGLEGEKTRAIFSSVAQAATVLGLSAEQTGGSLKAIEQIISKGTVSAEELRGQLGERLPGAFQIAARSIGVTTQELDKLLRTGSLTADELLPALAKELDRTFGPQAEQAAQGLNAQINRFNTSLFDLKIAIGETGLIDFFSDGIVGATNLTNTLTTQVIPAFGKLKQSIDALPSVGGPTGILGKFFGNSVAVNAAVAVFDVLTSNAAEIEETAVAIENVAVSLDKIITPGVKPEKQTVPNKPKAISEAERFITALIKESKQAGLTATEIRKLEAATLGVSKVADPLIDNIERTNKALQDQQEAARKNADDLRKIESITRSVRTEEEIYAETVAELDRLLETGLGIETHSRALRQAQDQLHGVADTTRTVTNEVDQLWIQAGRNIQSTLANSLFNFFDDGLKGMVRNVISTVGRIASEFAALRIAQGVGLGSLFASGGAAASSGASGLGFANLAAGGANLVSSGFGLTNLLSSGFTSLGETFGSSALASFGAGLGGTAATFSGPTAFFGGAGTAIGGSATGAAAGLGATAASFAGPLAIAGIAHVVGKLLAGDKKTGTFVDKVPVIGGFASALFGLGPAKFRQQFLGGNVSEAGFQDGFVTDVFRRKGGLLRGNKHSQQDAENADEILSLFDDSIKAFFGSTRALAENLDLDARALDDLTLNVAIQSEKKKVISQEQISAEITRLSDAIAGSVLPNISDLTRGNETYAATLSRIGSELDSLSNIMLLLGRSTEQARTELLGLSIAERTQLTDKMGGSQSANAAFDSFFSNFLSPEDQLKILSDKLLTELAAVDINRIVSPEEVADAFLSGTLSVEHITAALNPAMQALILQVDALKTSVEGATPSVEDLADNAFIALQASADAERNELTAQYNESVKEVNQSIGTLTALSGALKSSIETINPLNLDQARNNLRGAIAQASSGNIVDLNSVRTSLDVLSRNDTSAFRTREEFIRSQEENTSLLDQLGGITDNQLSAQERSLEALQIGFDGELVRLDSIVEGAQQQIDLLQGIHNSIQSSGVGGSLADFNTLSVAAGGSAIAGAGGSLPFNGNRNITGAQIEDFLAVNDNPFDIYNAARDNNVSALQLAANSPFTIEQINQFADDNGLPRLAVGTNFIPRDMPAFLHQGEEVKPKAFVDSERAERKELIGLMKKVLTATEVSTVSNNKVKKTLDKWEKVGMPKERAA